MTNHPTKQVTIWRALLDGDCKLIHKSQALLQDAVKDSFWYEGTALDRWIFEETDEDIPVVVGVAHDWGAEGGCGGVHIHYQCLYCHEEEWSDDDPNDQSPYLWFCQRGNGILLVITD